MRECPHCGCVADGSARSSDGIVAASDVLVIYALQIVGKRIVRMDRSRFARMNGRPWHEVHLLWQADANLIDKSLAGAWDSVPTVLESHGCCGVTVEQLTTVLDRYTRDLLATGTGHDVTELRYRLAAHLGTLV